MFQQEENMIRDVYDIKDESLKMAVTMVMNRILTAPKARGEDDVRILLVDGPEKKSVADEMRKLGDERGRPGFLRDASNVDKAQCLIIVGAKKLTMNLDCSMCGAPTCTEAIRKDINCVFPLTDLGIGLGSGLGLVQELGLDTRVMYTVGMAALSLKLFDDIHIRMALGLPFSVSSKSPFFDRK
jgi:uncharacterized ferredoxin-like protein